MPEPFGPIIECTSPAFTTRSMPRRICLSSTDNQQVGLSLFRVSCDRLVRTMPIEAGQSAFTDDLERLARFEREAKVLASLNHPT